MKNWVFTPNRKNCSYVQQLATRGCVDERVGAMVEGGED